MKDRGKILDEQIATFLTNKDIQGIQEFLGLEFQGSTFDEKGMISSQFLRMVMMRRDEIVYGLKGIQMEDGLSYEEVENKLELHPEEITYNADMYDSKDITVVHARGKGGQPMTFYYYRNDYDVNDDRSNGVSRQMRTLYQDGVISRVERSYCYVSNHHHYMCPEGKYRAGMGYIDGSLLVTMKNQQGNKEAALYQDDIIGCKYFEYDKEGKQTLCVNEESVQHDIVIDGQTYSVYDGFFEPTSNGYVIKRYNEGETIQDIKPHDIKRSVHVANPDLRSKIEDSLDEKSQKEVLGILQALDPIFKTMFNMQDIEDMRTSKMEKLVTWLGNFSKRLKNNPALAVQNDGVKATMRRAISKTIGMEQTPIDTTIEQSSENQH